MPVSLNPRETTVPITSQNLFDWVFLPAVKIRRYRDAVSWRDEAPISHELARRLAALAYPVIDHASSWRRPRVRSSGLSGSWSSLGRQKTRSTLKQETWWRREHTWLSPDRHKSSFFKSPLDTTFVNRYYRVNTNRNEKEQKKKTLITIATPLTDARFIRHSL